ncbi:MAG TPA: hypothetical protein VM694_04055 [Polyangium sp.]|nr:hypothetical protein [Polyangium sp.]
MKVEAAQKAVAGRIAPWAEKLAPWMGSWAEARLVRGVERLVFGEVVRPKHVLVAICDHFEPLWTGDAKSPGAAPLSRGLTRVAAWRRSYPALAASLRDANGRPPRHTFFYPGDQYDPALVEPIAELVAMGLGEVEVHLHHDRDTRSTLREKFEGTLVSLGRHGLVPRVHGADRWSFIHGNWCLANSRADGAHCGVDDELDLLHELGCYADFTFPSAPDRTQPRIVNSIYYPSGDVKRRKAHERGRPASVGDGRMERVLCMQGPLALSLRQGPGLPLRIDAGALTARDPATLPRLESWIDQGVSVRGKPEWVFVKLSTHGAPEREAESLLGAPQRRFHEALAWLGKQEGFRVHYVTAREMYNIARAAMDGRLGDPFEFRDYEVPPAARACQA